MTKAELRQLLQTKVEEMVEQGYEIPTYAMDLAATDRLKHGLKPHARPIDHDDQKEQEWAEFLSQAEAGTYQTNTRRLSHAPTKTHGKETASTAGTGSIGLWKVKRH